MLISHQTSISVASTSGASPISGTTTEVGGVELSIDQTLAAGTTDQLISVAFTAAGIQAIELVADQPMTVKTNGTGTSEVQTISISGTPTGGTFALAFGGAITSPIAYNASAGTVQSALQALSTIGASNATCTGGPLPGTPVVVAFAGTLANTNVATITANSGGLTGGSSPTVSVATTTPGLPSDKFTLQAGMPFHWSRSPNYYANPFTVDVTAFYVTSTNAGRIRGRILKT